MQQKHRKFCRANGTYFIEDAATRKQESLRTKCPVQAERLLNARNESHRCPEASRAMAMAYLRDTDPEAIKRTWQAAFDEAAKNKTNENTAERWQRAIKDKHLDPIRDMVILETKPEHFRKVLEKGTVATNAFLRRFYNFALDMDWLSRPVLPKRQWPAPQYKIKRAITLEEHKKIIARETNSERRSLYEVIWHTGASQSDAANLRRRTSIEKVGEFGITE